MRSVSDRRRDHKVSTKERQVNKRRKKIDAKYVPYLTLIRFKTVTIRKSIEIVVAYWYLTDNSLSLNIQCNGSIHRCTPKMAYFKYFWLCFFVSFLFFPIFSFKFHLSYEFYVVFGLDSKLRIAFQICSLNIHMEKKFIEYLLLLLLLGKTKIFTFISF